MKQTNKSCDNCKFKKDLKRWTYSRNEVEHEDLEGYACIALAYEDVVIHMVGSDHGFCEMWEPKG